MFLPPSVAPRQNLMTLLLVVWEKTSSMSGHKSIIDVITGDITLAYNVMNQ